MNLIRLKAFINKFSKGNHLAALSYIPFIGWLFPFYMNDDSEFCQENTRSGIILSIIAITATTCFIFLELFSFSNFKIIAYFFTLFIYFFYISYFIISIIGFVVTIRGNSFKVPIINKLVNSLNI